VSDFGDYYRRELRLLRERAAEFAREQPSVAGLLEAGSGDPDVERLLEGVAFLAADIRQKLDEDFGDVVHDFAQAICPHHLQPIPSATVIAFAPKANLRQTLTVEAGTHLQSVPVEGDPCHFRTSFDTPVSPLQLQGAERPDLDSDEAGASGVHVLLRLASVDVPLNALELPRLRIHLAGDPAEAADRYMLLTHYLRRVQLVDQGTREVVTLPPSAVRPVGFAPHEGLLPREGNVMPVFGMLQDYFLFSEKFLFLDIDLAAWRERGTGPRFDLVFECEEPPFPVPTVAPDRFVLHATPAINAFSWESEPIVLDHRQSEYRLDPAGPQGRHLAVHSVQAVEGIARGASARREYRPFSAFLAGRHDDPVYQVHYRRAAADDTLDVTLSVALPPGRDLRHREVLKARLTCTNGERAEVLLPNDIRTPTQDTPELVTFTNLTAPTPARQAPMDTGKLWQLISHLSLNFLSIADADNLQALLRHYAIPGAAERARDLPNLKRIESIREVIVEPDERLLGESFVRGRAILVRLRGEHFTGHGDRYLFGSVLNRLFADSSALNTYTALTLEDSATGERTAWPPMLGTRALM
jgi:type VI secretion system protein ImpG